MDPSNIINPPEVNTTPKRGGFWKQLGFRPGLRNFYVICKEESISLILATIASPTNIVMASADPVLA